jgi:hypothetical protein
MRNRTDLGEEGPVWAVHLQFDNSWKHIENIIKKHICYYVKAFDSIIRKKIIANNSRK